MENTDDFGCWIYPAFSDACAAKAFCKNPALCFIVFAYEKQETAVMQKSPRM